MSLPAHTAAQDLLKRWPFSGRPRLRDGLVVVSALWLAMAASCAPSLSSFRPAHVPQKGHVHVTAGADVSVPTGSAGDTVDAGKTLARASRSRELTQSERDQLFDAGVLFTANPPSLLQHFLIAYAPLARTEVSLRYAGGAWRLGGRYQIWEQGNGHDWDLTAGVGLSRQSVGIPLSEVINLLEINDYERWGFDLPLAIGRRGSWYRAWGGPRLMYTRGDGSVRLNLPATNSSAARTETAAAEANGFYWGGQAGLAIGYQHVFLGFELTLVQFSGEATIGLNDRTRTVDVSTFVVYPGLALMVEL